MDRRLEAFMRFAPPNRIYLPLPFPAIKFTDCRWGMKILIPCIWENTKTLCYRVLENVTCGVWLHRLQQTHSRFKSPHQRIPDTSMISVTSQLFNTSISVLRLILSLWWVDTSFLHIVTYNCMLESPGTIVNLTSPSAPSASPPVPTPAEDCAGCDVL